MTPERRRLAIQGTPRGYTGRTRPGGSSTPGDSVANSYRVYAATGTPRALLALLPGWGDDVNAFEPSSRSTPSTLPARLASRGVVTITALPHPETLFETDAMVVRLDSMVAEVLQRYRIPRERVAIGGISAAGTGAVRYAQHCAQHRYREACRVASVFAVDPPLKRLPHLRRDRPPQRARSNIQEERTLLNTIRGAMGGTPDQARPAYQRHSPVTASAIDGGNARHLASTPVRIYTEPHVHWWMRERNMDLHGMNSVDHAALMEWWWAQTSKGRSGSRRAREVRRALRRTAARARPRAAEPRKRQRFMRCGRRSSFRRAPASVLRSRSRVC